MRCGSGRRRMIRPPKLRTRVEPYGQDGDDDQADREDELDGRRHAAAEAPEAGREAKQHDREQVEDALDEHRPERSRQRDDVVDPQQVGAVDVAQLGRNEAVDQPADEDDLGRVADLPGAGTAQQQLPAVAAQREADVVHAEGERAGTMGSRGDQSSSRWKWMPLKVSR